MGAVLRLAQSQQALKQKLIGYHDGRYRAEVDRSFVAIESDDIAFAENHVAQADRACRQVDVQGVTSYQADLAQLSCHHSSV